MICQLRLLPLWAAFCFLLAPDFCPAREEVWEEQLQEEARNRINLLIKGLNGTHEIRDKYERELLTIAAGRHRQLVIRQLRFALSEGNSQVTEGVTEVFTRLNDPATIPALEEELLYNPSLDVRSGLIEHLPLFCVTSNSDRMELLPLLEGGERHLPRRLIDALRAPPFNPRTGNYDLTADEDVRGRIETVLIGQLNPVESIIEAGLEQRNQKRALELLKQMLGVDMGYTRSAWIEFWSSRGRTFKSPMASDILDTQIEACRMLGYLGVEGRESLVRQARWVMSTPHNSLRESALNMLQEALAFSVEQEPVLVQRLQRPNIKQPEEIWIKRRQEGTKRLQALALEFGRDYLDDPGLNIRLALVDLLGASRLPEAVPMTAQALRSDGQSSQMRLHVCAALGNIGGQEAVVQLEQLAAFRGISVDKQTQVEEYQRVRSSFLALGEIAGKTVDGKLVRREAASANRAAEFLISQLTDARRFEGAPEHGDPQRQTIRFEAREVLREILQNPSESYEQAFWRSAYQTAVAGK